MTDTQKFDPAAPQQTPASGSTASAPAAAEPKPKTFNRRSVLAMAGCGVAGLVVGGALASWGVTTQSIASGRIELRTTPAKMIVTD
ncbi:MAG: 4Fe-4S ferredoxin, partial [Adlercreutzia sp.]|nr:4Fe-4S ferredoxin [Adlercreutzia sp.]